MLEVFFLALMVRLLLPFFLLMEPARSQEGLSPLADTRSLRELAPLGTGCLTALIKKTTFRCAQRGVLERGTAGHFHFLLVSYPPVVPGRVSQVKSLSLRDHERLTVSKERNGWRSWKGFNLSARPPPERQSFIHLLKEKVNEWMDE